MHAQFSWASSSRGIAEGHGNSVHPFEELPPRQLVRLAFPPTAEEDFSFSPFLAPIVTVCFIHYNHPGGCEVVTSCCFDSYFPND